MTASELDALLTVARKHKVTDLEIPGVLRAHLQVEYEDTADGTQVGNSVINAGGWKRRPDLDTE